MTTDTRDEALVRVRELQTHYAVRGSFIDRLLGREQGRVKAVDDISLDIRRGEVLGLVGESGSGKTTLGRTLLRLVEPSHGSITFDGRDITHIGQSELRPLRRKMQVVFQDPHASLNPGMDIETAVGHPLTIHLGLRDRRELRERVSQALTRVGLVPPEQYLHRYPNDLSGGQKQRAVLARAIILDPELLIADEPVSMLDMSVRAKILELMLRLKEQLGLTFLYITHDLATAKFFCDRIAIMYLGRIVEIGESEAIYADPKHPYTQALLRAIPEPDPSRTVPRDLPRGEVPDAVAPPRGCSFHPRCPLAFELCGWEGRDLRAHLEARWAGMSEAQFTEERAMVGDLDRFASDGDGDVVHVPPGAGVDAPKLLAWLERVRRDSAEDPLWRGVRSMAVDGDRVAVAFHPAVDPQLLRADGIEVACHLYDPEVMRRAEALRTSPPAEGVG